MRNGVHDRRAKDKRGVARPDLVASAAPPTASTSALRRKFLVALGKQQVADAVVGLSQCFPGIVRGARVALGVGRGDLGLEQEGIR